MTSDIPKRQAQAAWKAIRKFVSETSVEFTAGSASGGKSLALTVTTAKWGKWSWTRRGSKKPRG